MTPHDQFQQELPAYVVHRLEGEDLRRLEEHLEVCGDCRGLAAAWRALTEAMRDGGDALFEPHPTESELREFAIGGGAAAQETIPRHLRVCVSCDLEVQAWRRRRPGSFGSRPSLVAERGRRLLPIVAMSAAAGLILGLGLALMLGRLQTDAGPYDGGVVRHLLLSASPTRGTGPIVTQRLWRDQRYLEIDFRLTPPQTPSVGEPCRFEIRREDGRKVWTTTVTAAALRQALDAEGAIGFVFPTTLIVPGRYECRIIAPGSTGETGTEIIPLEILPSD